MLLATLMLAAAVGGGPEPTVPPVPPQPPDPPVEMTTRYLVLLVKGPRWTDEHTKEGRTLGEGHVAQIRALAASGRLIAAGPLLDDSRIRGILVLKAANLEEARTLAAQDPAVKAGRFVAEVHPWLVRRDAFMETAAQDGDR